MKRKIVLLTILAVVVLLIFAGFKIFGKSNTNLNNSVAPQTNGTNNSGTQANPSGTLTKDQMNNLMKQHKPK